jgi:hypothetical protein
VYNGSPAPNNGMHPTADTLLVMKQSHKYPGWGDRFDFPEKYAVSKPYGVFMRLLHLKFEISNLKSSVALCVNSVPLW